MKRKIIQIDEKKCTGCGLCIPNCHEGALQIIDGKARLISDIFCDGLGACLGHCPEGAIEITEREAGTYDERTVMAGLATQGKNTMKAHLDHLRDHDEQDFLKEAIAYLKENNIDMIEETGKVTLPEMNSELKQWPVQLHLLNPQASYFKNADVILAADCTAFSMGNFHSLYLKGKSLAIACPKLDSNKESYVEKLTSMIAETKINSLTVIMMEVPCCGGLLQMAKIARDAAGRNIPIKKTILSIRGEVLVEEWI